MKLFFWQNINSIHQSVFFKALSENQYFDTTLVVTERIHQNRVEMGWGNPHIKGLKLIDLSDNDEQLANIIDENNNADTLHMFSGIHAFPKVYRSLIYAIDKKCRVGIFTEPYDLRGFKGELRRLRGFFYKWRYESHIEFVLTTGKIGVEQFRQFGFPDRKIFEWAYCVENSQNSIFVDTSVPLKIIFAGSLIKRKGYDILLSTFQKLQSENIPFIANLYCLNKEDSKNLNQILFPYQFKNNVQLHPFLPNLELRKKISDHDVLVLPSRHDGWGAVVSESLAEGTPVIVSNKCGSSTLISELNGIVLHALSNNALFDAINKFIKKGKLSLAERELIRENYEEVASGFTLVQYFNEILHYTNNHKIDIKPECPWSKN